MVYNPSNFAVVLYGRSLGRQIPAKKGNRWDCGKRRKATAAIAAAYVEGVDRGHEAAVAADIGSANNTGGGEVDGHAVVEALGG